MNNLHFPISNLEWVLKQMLTFLGFERIEKTPFTEMGRAYEINTNGIINAEFL